MVVLVKEAVGSTKEVDETFDVLGFDISHLPRDRQLLFVVIGLFTSALSYGFLQELVTVQIFSRRLALFLSSVQFAGYTLFCFLMRIYVYRTKGGDNVDDSLQNAQPRKPVPKHYYISISLLRALELGLTNVAMQYINYPAKTLLKSSRVIFTMLFGMWLQQKKYGNLDYLVVAAMVGGLFIFLRADAKSDDAVFNYLGVIFLVLSLLCDGAIVNISEAIMSRPEFGVRQDEFISRVYSLAFIAVTLFAAMTGELDTGILWLFQDGTVEEFEQDSQQPTWSIMEKVSIIFLFTLTGYLALFFCQTLTKHFGALVMSIASTARKATSLFLSFLLFNNKSSPGHALGAIIFVSALGGKILMRMEAENKRKHKGGGLFDIESLSAMFSGGDSRKG